MTPHAVAGVVALKEAGADAVVTVLAELELTDVPGGVRISGRPVLA